MCHFEAVALTLRSDLYYAFVNVLEQIFSRVKLMAIFILVFILRICKNVD